MPITLPPDTRNQLIASLRRYAAENLDEGIGDRTTDLGGVCHRPEFTYWKTPSGKSR